MQTIDIKDVHSDKVTVGEYRIEGWVRTHRQSKNICFIELNDGTAFKGLQVVIEPALPSYAAVAQRITTGAALSVAGTLVESPAKGQKYEFKAAEVILVGESDAETYPLQKKGHTLEFLRECMHLRPRSNTFGAVFRVRSAASAAVHRFFQDRGFVYVNTPIITAADCEGAGELFQVTTLDLDKLRGASGAVDYSQDFFGQRASLTVSGQLEGEIFATALKKVYTFGPTFRAENSNTTRHLSEFWMIEPEVAFCDLKQDMRLGYEFLQSIISDVLRDCRADLEFLQAREWADKEMIATLEAVVQADVKVLEYTEAIEVLTKSGRKFEFPPHWGMDLQAEHEKYLSDEYAKGPVYVINFPKDIKAFYMRMNDDGKTVAAMDLLVPRLGEIIGGSQREERLDRLTARMREMHIPEQDLWWYLDLRKFGSVPHAGFGLGFERFLMYVTGMQNIRDVIPVPRFPGYAKF